MPIGGDDLNTLLHQELHQAFVVFVEVTPKRELRLQIHSLDVGSEKACLGWTPRVETDMVDTITLANLEITAPRLDVHRHMASQRKHTGIMLSTEEREMVIDRELCALCTELPQTKTFLNFIMTFYLHMNLIEIGVSLTPKLQAVISVDHPDMSKRFGCGRYHLFCNHITVITTPGYQSELGLRRLLELSFQININQHFLPASVCGNGHVTNIGRSTTHQVDSTDDTVPVSLGVFGIGMGIANNLRRHCPITVIHHHSDTMVPRFQPS